MGDYGLKTAVGSKDREIFFSPSKPHCAYLALHLRQFRYAEEKAW